MLRRTASVLARRWAGGVYAGFVPVSADTPDGAADFLDDLWRVAPARVALAATGGALLFSLSPPFLIGRLRLFHQLDEAERERLLERAMTLRPYPLRLWFFGVKSMALLAVLRDERCRETLGLDTPGEPS